MSNLKKYLNTFLFIVLSAQGLKAMDVNTSLSFDDYNSILKSAHQVIDFESYDCFSYTHDGTHDLDKLNSVLGVRKIVSNISKDKDFSKVIYNLNSAIKLFYSYKLKQLDFTEKNNQSISVFNLTEKDLKPIYQQTVKELTGNLHLMDKVDRIVNNEDLKMKADQFYTPECIKHIVIGKNLSLFYATLVVIKNLTSIEEVMDNLKSYIPLTSAIAQSEYSFDTMTIHKDPETLFLHEFLSKLGAFQETCVNILLRGSKQKEQHSFIQDIKFEFSPDEDSNSNKKRTTGIVSIIFKNKALAIPGISVSDSHGKHYKEILNGKESKTKSSSSLGKISRGRDLVYARDDIFEILNEVVLNPQGTLVNKLKVNKRIIITEFDKRNNSTSFVNNQGQKSLIFFEILTHFINESSDTSSQGEAITNTACVGSDESSDPNVVGLNHKFYTPDELVTSRYNQLFNTIFNTAKKLLKVDRNSKVNTQVQRLVRFSLLEGTDTYKELPKISEFLFEWTKPRVSRFIERKIEQKRAAAGGLDLDGLARYMDLSLCVAVEAPTKKDMEQIIHRVYALFLKTIVKKLEDGQSRSKRQSQSFDQRGDQAGIVPKIEELDEEVDQMSDTDSLAADGLTQTKDFSSETESGELMTADNLAIFRKSVESELREFKSEHFNKKTNKAESISEDDSESQEGWTQWVEEQRRRSKAKKQSSGSSSNQAKDDRSKEDQQAEKDRLILSMMDTLDGLGSCPKLDQVNSLALKTMEKLNQHEFIHFSKDSKGGHLHLRYNIPGKKGGLFTLISHGEHYKPGTLKAFAKNFKTFLESFISDELEIRQVESPLLTNVPNETYSLK